MPKPGKYGPPAPGPVLPARELMADLLMEVGRPQEAFQEFAAALRTAPHRFHAVRGAARAAEAAGKHDVARQYLRELMELARSPETNDGRMYLAVKSLRAIILLDINQQRLLS